LYSVVPLFTFILGFSFLKEGAQATKIFALFLGTFGVAIILSGDFGKLALETKFFLGVVAVLTAAFLTATQAVIAKKFSLNYPTWITVLLIMFAQVVIATPFAFSQKWQVSLFAVGSVIFLSIFSSIIAFFFYVGGFKILKSSTVTLVGYIEPFLAAIWGYLFLQQVIKANIIFGGILVLVSGYIAIRSEEK
jgi:drug/metabolite transporter (DMT)-like permease